MHATGGSRHQNHAPEEEALGARLWTHACKAPPGASSGNLSAGGTQRGSGACLSLLFTLGLSKAHLWQLSSHFPWLRLLPKLRKQTSALKCGRAPS